jgi:hypothetical protein
MKKRILLFTATLGVAYLAISGYAAGPFPFEGNLTGSGTKAASCGGSGCHAAGSASNTYAANATLGIVSLYSDAAATAIVTGGYVPGTKYYVKMLAGNKTPLPKFGFQISCVSGTTTKVNAGTMVAIASSNTVVRTGTINVLEQTKALSPNTTLQYQVIFEWTAPPAGTGSVTFYAVINAVNANGSESGDQPSIGLTKTITEKTTSINEINNNIASKIFPNPCSNMLNIEAASNAKYVATVYDLAGRQVLAASHQSNIDVSSLSAGVYLLRLNTEDAQQTVTFIKQ